MIGAGANRKMTGRMLREFVEKTGIPFFTTQMGKGVVDETHPLFLGNARRCPPATSSTARSSTPTASSTSATT